MKNCVFCKIAKGKIPAAKIYEDNEFLAILDTNPNVKGMALVLTKKHYNSDAFDMTNEIYTKLMLTTKKVVKILEKGLGVKRVAMVMEGLGINHMHIKLYPIHGLKQKFEEFWTKEKVFFKKYPGYITTQLGPEAKQEDLQNLAKKIREKTN